MAVNIVPYHRSTPTGKKAAQKGRNAPSRSGVGRESRTCMYCGRRLGANVKGNYCSASHRVSMSRLKRKLADNACQDAFHWQPGEGEALIQKHGLPRMEVVLGMAGWHWEPAQREWVKAESKGQVA